MFERFTSSARAVVIEAQAHARRLGHDYVGTEHLLLALLASPGSVSEVLTTGGLTPDEVEADVVTLVGRSGTEEDRAALAALGIDIDRVREVVEAAFGEGALAPRERVGRRGRRRPVVSGHRRFTPRAKKCLELSLREALRLRHRSIDAEHIALGILREGRGLACQVIARRGASLPALRASLETSLRSAA
jgi:ATP-dependent Clp protease ATP-binding subunit ClpA